MLGSRSSRLHPLEDVDDHDGLPPARLGATFPGFERDGVVDVATVSAEGSVHGILDHWIDRALARGVGIDNLKKMIAENNDMPLVLVKSLQATIGAHFKKPETLPRFIPAAVIQQAVLGMLSYFESSGEGSLYSHLQSLSASVPANERAYYDELFFSKKFQMILLDALKSFMGRQIDEKFTDRMQNPQDKAKYVGYYARKLWEKTADKREWRMLFMDGLKHGVDGEDLMRMILNARTGLPIEIIGATQFAAAQEGVSVKTPEDVLHAALAAAREEIADEQESSALTLQHFKKIKPRAASVAMNPFQYSAMVLAMSVEKESALEASKRYTDDYFEVVSEADVMRRFYFSEWTDRGAPRAAPLPWNIAPHELSPG